MTLKASVNIMLRIFVGLLFVLAPEVYAVGSSAVDSEVAYSVTGISGSQEGNEYVVRIQGTTPPTYILYELFEPKPRVVVDIADAIIDDIAGLPIQLNDSPVSQIAGKLLVDEDIELVRLEMLLSGDSNYSAILEENDIVVTFAGWTMEESAPLSSAEEASIPAVSTDEEINEEEVPSADSFSFPGYTKQPVTVDFHKIDLHNVFRLFGEISGLNIVIAEGVKGVLTLSLNNVPWDFALDIILNLKDLQKEERFNTIVISPNSDDFKWSEGPADTIEFKADDAPLTIKKQIEVPEGVVEAQKLLRKASAAEKREDYKKALSLYEEAFKMWPENSDIANRVSSLFLVHLGMNARSVYYAKQALNIDPFDRDASLNAAIALAKMQKKTAAQEYFEQATEGDDAPKEALFSYALFAENNTDYITALLLLSRHENLYGDTLETMVAKARIFDKQGNVERATQEYKSVLLSGFDLPPDLRRYVKGRAVQAD